MRRIVAGLAVLLGLWGLGAVGAVAPTGAVAGVTSGHPAAVTHATGLVYVVPIRGAIEPALLYVVRRGVREAQAQQARAIVFVMDTPGGTLDAAGSIIRTIQNIQVPTYTFVENHAFSAGAIIALATRHIYMAPGSVIGDAMPIMMTPWGGVQEMPEALQEKAVSATAALVRSAAEQGGHDPQLAEAMVRRQLGFQVGTNVICPKGQLLTLTDKEAARPLGPGGQPLLSAGTVKDLPALLQAIGRPGAEVQELHVTVSERIARFIAALAPLFLMAGLLGIYIEIKTPGFGLPGILGGISLAIFFWGHHIAGLAGLEDVMLFVVGVGLVLAEVFLFPGVGLLGLAGLGLILWGLLSAMLERLPGAPWYPTWPALEGPLVNLALALIGTALAAAVVARFLPKTLLFRRLVLQASTSRQTGYTAPEVAPRAELLGREGVALSFLRPAGMATFGEHKVDVVTRGDYLPAGTRVRIVEVHGNRIVVEAGPANR